MTDKVINDVIMAATQLSVTGLVQSSKLMFIFNRQLLIFIHEQKSRKCPDATLVETKLKKTACKRSQKSRTKKKTEIAKYLEMQMPRR